MAGAFVAGAFMPVALMGTYRNFMVDGLQAQLCVMRDETIVSDIRAS